MPVSDAAWANEAFTFENRGKLTVLFHTKQEQHNAKTLEAGRPIFHERIFIKKIVPGDQLLVIDRPMRESDKNEFPVEWARYQNNKSSAPQGMPIEMWPEITETQKAEFRALNIFTVEQFANLPDSAGGKIMGFNGLRDKARSFVLAARESEKFGEIKQAMADQIAALNAKIEELQAQSAGQLKRGRGRPPKAKEPAGAAA